MSIVRFAPLMLMLLLSSCGGDSTGSGTDANQPSLASGDGAPGDMAAARAYVAQFTRDDPSACFDEVALDQPSLDGPAGDQPAMTRPPVRVVVAIDGSGSMAARVGGNTKLELAREAALGFVDGLPSAVEASILVFGQQGNNSSAGKARSCAGVDVLAPMSRDRARLGAALGQVRAVGWTPLAAGLERAQSLLAASATPGEQVIYVVSDGEETCGGDPVAVAERINRGSTRAIVNIIGFGLPSREAAALRAVADAGGGRFVNVDNRPQHDRLLERIRESNRTSLNAIRAGNARNMNSIRTANAVNRASICTRNMINAESVRMSNALSLRKIRGEPVPFAEAAQSLLKQRHDAITARDRAFRARLSRDNDAAQQGIEDAAAAAR